MGLFWNFRSTGADDELKSASNVDPLPTTPLGRPIPGAALSIATGTRAQLTAGVTRISIRNTGTVDATYKLGGSTVTAGANDDHIAPGERLDIAVHDGEYLAVLGATVKVTQLGA
jgi:hypothetical protein